MKVLIIIPAYNESENIERVVDDLILNYPEYDYLVVNDCSKDNTADILERYAQQYPDRITHYRSGLRCGCARKHFMHLLRKFHDADYIMFCD